MPPVLGNFREAFVPKQLEVVICVIKKSIRSSALPGCVEEFNVVNLGRNGSCLKWPGGSWFANHQQVAGHLPSKIPRLNAADNAQACNPRYPFALFCCSPSGLDDEESNDFWIFKVKIKNLGHRNVLRKQSFEQKRHDHNAHNFTPKNMVEK